MNKEITTPKNLREFVEYSDGAVVSKELLDNDNGSLTLFAFDAGQRISEHSAPYHAFVQVLEGEGIFTVAGKENTVGEGEILLMPADIPHALRAQKKFKMLLTMIKK